MKTDFEFAHKTLKLADGASCRYVSLPALEAEGMGSVSRLPRTVRIVLESLVRFQGHEAYTPEHVRHLAAWLNERDDRRELPYMPSRILLQDFTGVPCVVDLAALRSALVRAGQDPEKIEPVIPVDLVIDHSVQLDATGSSDALETNLKREFERNRERYMFLRWGQQAFKKLRVLPPGLGICHQVNMEMLAKCVATQDSNGSRMAFPDTLVGTDSHTVMINSMGVVGWGVGGIEAEAAMLGQPIPILTPIVTGVRLTGELHPEASSTDLALTITNMLRKHGVVGHFIEYFGPGLDSLPLAARAPLANMAPEYGATMGFFPVDDATLQYLRETGRDEAQIDLVERYYKEQGLFRTADSPQAEYSQVLELDLSTVHRSTAGPSKPHDQVRIKNLGARFRELLTKPRDKGGFGVAEERAAAKADAGQHGEIGHGAVVIASITSCTNTSNPELLLGAGIMAKKAVERGLSVPKHVRTSFAPGSRVVTDYMRKSGLMEPLEQLGFHVAAYGCATCIGNSGPLDEPISKAIREEDLVAAAVLSGNRNFEGRIHPLTKANFLCSPTLVLAYALKGTVAENLKEDPIGKDKDGEPVYLDDIWPTPEEIQQLIGLSANPELYRERYGKIEGTTPMWDNLPVEESAAYAWDEDSTYIQDPPFFVDFADEPRQPSAITGARALAVFGDFITTDHISPAGAIPADGPAGRYLQEHGVEEKDFNSFGSRRGNHEVMMRGTFANIRIRNTMVDREGGYTVHVPSGEEMAIYDAAMRYQEEQTPLIVLTGKLYGAGSSRDWAAKGTQLLGVQAVIAESFERIHRSNLVEMGVLPLEFVKGQNASELALTGRETFTISGMEDGIEPGMTLNVEAAQDDGTVTKFKTLCRIDTPIEVEYYLHGGILDYVLRRIMQPE
jgi:aconitate hydratase